jgi:hypothetical protein
LSKLKDCAGPAVGAIPRRPCGHSWLHAIRETRMSAVTNPLTFDAQGSPHFILLNSTILFDVYMLGKICIMNAVLRGHSLKSVDADALAEMRSG